MSNQIEPYSMMKKTNIKEHNDMINKINEIVDVINDVNLDTINAEIDALKTKTDATDGEIATIKDKDTAQDTEIDGITKSLVSDVTASFDNNSRELKVSVEREDSTSIDATVVIPSSSETGQYSAGNGITIDDYQIAVDTEVVALKTDIPDVPAIDDLTQRVETLETEMPTKASVDDVNSKVAIAQGIENAGKVLGVGGDGNVAPVDVGGSGGGEIWEEIDLNNFPTDLKSNEKLKVEFSIGITNPSTSSWTSSFSNSPNIYGNTNTFKNGEIVCRVGTDTGNSFCGEIVNISVGENVVSIAFLEYVTNYSTINQYDSATVFTIVVASFNGVSKKIRSIPINKSNIGSYVYKLYRLKEST